MPLLLQAAASRATSSRHPVAGATLAPGRRAGDGTQDPLCSKKHRWLRSEDARALIKIPRLAGLFLLFRHGSVGRSAFSSFRVCLDNSQLASQLRENRMTSSSTVQKHITGPAKCSAAISRVSMASLL